MSAGDDSPEARAARAAQRRGDQADLEHAQIRAALEAEKTNWRGLQRACAPWGWPFDGVNAYIVGFGFVMTAYLALWAAFMYLDVSFLGFFESLGPGSDFWFPIAVVGLGIALPFGLRAIATPAAERAIATEQAWLAALPFPPPTLRALAGAYARGAHARGGGELRVSIYCEGGERPTARVAALLDAASIPANISTHSGDELRLEMTVQGASDYKVGRNVRLLVHDVAALVLAPLHKETPLARVELRG